MWGVLGNGRDGGRRRRRRIQSPVQVSPELLLVLRVDQFIHTLMHDVRLTGGTRGRVSWRNAGEITDFIMQLIIKIQKQQKQKKVNYTV